MFLAEETTDRLVVDIRKRLEAPAIAKRTADGPSAWSVVGTKKLGHGLRYSFRLFQQQKVPGMR
jgi:hypothetical protein